MIGEATLGMTDQALGGGEDCGVLAKFFMHPVKHEAKSKEAGHPVFVEEIYVETMVPGTRSLNHHPMYIGDDRKWPKAWAAYKANEEAPKPEGFLIEEWPVVTRGTVETLKAMNVFTVEQLAQCSDTQMQTFMGGMDFRQKAREYLEIANKSATAAQLAAELSKRDDQIKILTEVVEELKLKINKPSKKKAKVKS